MTITLTHGPTNRVIRLPLAAAAAKLGVTRAALLRPIRRDTAGRTGRFGEWYATLEAAL